MSIAFDSAGDLVARLKRKEIGSRELTEHYIARIEEHDPAVNAIVVRDFDRALAAADAADRALAEGRDLGPLHGLPMTIKESFNIAGLPTTWGIPAFAENIAEDDAEVVKRFKAAGAVFMGKTNVPMELADFQSYNDIYGTTGNPWDTDRTPGGSSGGAAAALAAGLTGLENGSDIGGSIRNPAHFCGVYGHKPTWNIVPPLGHALPGMVAPPDIAVVGPLARSAEDLAVAMDVVAGADPLNAPGWKLDLPRPTMRGLEDYRVALWPSDDAAPVSAEIADRVQAVGETLASLGATVSDTARPEIDVERAYHIYLYMLNGVLTAGRPDDEFAELVREAEAIDPADGGRGAAFARAGVQRHRTWLHRSQARELLRMAWRAFFDEWDILLCPTMATTAFPHDHSPQEGGLEGGRTITVDGREQPYFKQMFWAGIPTVAYLPSTVFPTGPSPSGLPIGLQAVAAEFNDHTSIDFARLLGGEIGGFVPPPGYE